MGDYFKPLRRKIGVVTLLLACVFMAGWVRSQTIKDEFTINRIEGVFHHLTSNCSRLAWKTVTIRNPKTHRYISPFYFARPADVDHLYRGRISPEAWKWRWQFWGFEFGRFTSSLSHDEKIYVVPYWSITVPLTLLSFWLLLLKPSKSTSNKFTDPIPEKVT